MDDAGVVHMDVDDAEEPFGLAHSLANRALARHVAPDAGGVAACGNDQLRRLLGARLVDVRHRDLGAAAGELQRDDTADITARTDDEGILVFKCEHGVVPLVRYTPISVSSAEALATPRRTALS